MGEDGIGTEQVAEPQHPGTMNRADRRARGYRVIRSRFDRILAAGEPVTTEMAWQFKAERDKTRRKVAA